VVTSATRLPSSLTSAALLVAVGTVAAPTAADIDVRRAAPFLERATPRGLITRGSDKLPLLVPLPDGVTAAERALMPVAPGLGAIYLEPAALGAYLATYPELRPTVSPPRFPLLDQAGQWTRAPAYSSHTGFDGTGVVVGIIDTGIDAAHADFRDADGQTRIAWLMQREPPQGYQPELEDQFGCTDPAQAPCAIYSASDLDTLLASQPGQVPADHDGHGTHVASIAAGNGGVSLPDPPVYFGVAPGATLIIASPSPGGGFSDPAILNAARFIFDRAAAMGMPAVVNVSLGSDYGPHDGTSALEKGLAALVGDGEPGKVMVVAAGNSGTLYWQSDGGPYGIHTEAHISPHAVTRAPIVQPGAGADRVDGSAFVWVTFQPGDTVSVGLEGPDGEWIGLTDSGEEQGYDEDGNTAAVINALVNGKSTLTQDSNSAVVYWDGHWQGDDEFAVLLSGKGDAQLWVTGIGGGAPGQSLGLNFARALRTGTISVPASHPELIAVGCTLNRIEWSALGMQGQIALQSFGGATPAIPDSTCYFSAAGPNARGVMKPDLLAPGAMVAAAMSQDADPRLDPLSIFHSGGCPNPEVPCYVTDERHAITSGTSMSAPFVTGAAALLLQADPSLTQAEVKELLQAGAARPTGWVPYDDQQGPGELDMLGALQVYEERLGNGAQADVQASYVVLASPYARPDPAWPLRGVVEMRHADGSVAMGVTTGQLRLHVSGGTVVEPLSLVRGGLFQFAVAAPRGSGGSEITIDVRYRGHSLGARSLPVAVDAWAASAGVEALGACGVGGSSDLGGPWLWTLMLGWAAGRSRRRRA
jgi:subtilisin family serine protease